MIVCEGKSLVGKEEIRTGRILYFKESIIKALYKDLASEDQNKNVKDYLRMLIDQLENR